MTFQEAIRSGLSKYITWQGRASRSEFWFFYLFFLIALVVASIIDGILGTKTESGVGYLYILVVLGLFLPTISVVVRRLHDTDRSGWWYWIGLIPLVGLILLIVWWAAKGTTGSNQYGPDPLGGDLTAAFS